MQNKRKFVFYYLNTGAGHISAARVLIKAMQDVNPDVEVKMLNGVPPHRLGHVMLERGYKFSSNILHGLFPLMYDLCNYRPFQTICMRVYQNEAIRHIRAQIIEERATDVVSFHFALTPLIKRVLKTIPWKVNLTCIVTDPFTVPICWFYERYVDYMVFSEQAKKIGMKQKVPENKIKVVPFLMNEKYRTIISDEEKRQLKIKHGFDPDKKIVLLVGGGEGLPGATEIINQCIQKKNNFTIAAVCGRDAAKRRAFSLISKTYPRLDLHVYGFIDYLDELIKICDCAVIKAGPATMMEILANRKPVIICRYMHNQELGNMRYAVNNRVGWFIQKPKLIYKKINELLNDAEFDSKMKKKFENVQLDTDASKIAHALLDK